MEQFSDSTPIVINIPTYYSSSNTEQTLIFTIYRVDCISPPNKLTFAVSLISAIGTSLRYQDLWYLSTTKETNIYSFTYLSSWVYSQSATVNNNMALQDWLLCKHEHIACKVALLLGISFSKDAISLEFLAYAVSKKEKICKLVKFQLNIWSYLQQKSQILRRK